MSLGKCTIIPKGFSLGLDYFAFLFYKSFSCHYRCFACLKKNELGNDEDEAIKQTNTHTKLTNTVGVGQAVVNMKLNFFITFGVTWVLKRA